MPHLKVLTQITYHCYTPACLSAGCRDVAHKMAALAWQIHIDIPTAIPLDAELDNNLGNTSDMGDEMSGPTFRVYQAPLAAIPWQVTYLFVLLFMRLGVFPLRLFVFTFVRLAFSFSALLCSFGISRFAQLAALAVHVHVHMCVSICVCIYHVPSSKYVSTVVRV